MSLTLEINPYLLLTSITIILVFIYRYMQETFTILERLGIPGPKPIWVFGNTHEFKDKNVLDVFSSWREKYGNVYGFYEGFRAGVVINDPEFARDILNKHFEKFYIRTSYRPFIYYPDDLRLISIDGEHWKHQRAVLNKMLNSTATLKQVVGKVVKSSVRMLKGLETERKLCIDGLNMSQFIDNFVSESVARIVLDMDADEIDRHAAIVHRFERESMWSAAADNEISGLARLFPSLTPLLKLGDKKFKSSHDDLVALLRVYLPKAISAQNNNKMKEEDHPSLLSYLTSSRVLSRDIDGSLMRRDLETDETIAHVLSFIGEIFTTMTASIQFMVYELARNPECQEELYKEVTSLFPNEEDVTMDKLQYMEYFDMFFSETYRKHPIAPGVSRICTENCRLRGVNFRQGMTVRVMTSPLYSDPKIFQHPNKFNPHRFSKEDRMSRHQYSFLPFGQGPRGCPGQKLATMTMKIAMIYLVRRYTFSTSNKTQIPLKEALRPSLCPADGVHVNVTPR
ncbi:cytochrome P450 3A40-like [Mya arenaria]|uniref:cytochrome P450 3A40-like n=1 Tax=Mya arenaria TaxID=6604 RepID=UPI0022E93C52|nr:cytochrome P450 3A40-like [Mya arenaria]XP_052785513.1 cytochrome P450 3A40-like [Mya arenaria]XP_052785514.1 cytochrome P450 3A40-like [Mya arenaria]